MQVGVFADPTAAVDKLKAANVPYYTEAVKDNLTRVRAGPFPSKRGGGKGARAPQGPRPRRRAGGDQIRMSWLDIGVLVVLVASIAWGVWRGLVHEVLSLGGWILAFLAANLLCDSLPSELSRLHAAGVPRAGRLAGACSSAVLLIVAAGRACCWARSIKTVGLVKLDRWLGALFGLARGLLILLAFALVAGPDAAAAHAGLDRAR